MKMPSKLLLTYTLGISVLSCSIGAIAQTATKPETLIKWRQSVYQTIAWNSSRIKASVEGQYNKEEVIKSANAIAALSSTNLPGLFAPGTEQGKGWRDTTVKPAVFSDGKRFADAHGNFTKEANELASVANHGDAAAVKEQYAKLTKTCKACHDDFKNKD
jgi:cytochrome c556